MTTRVWVGTTLPGLAAAWAAGALPAGPASAVTAAVRAWFDDEEEQEFAAQLLAGRAALPLLLPDGPWLRVVVTAEVPDSDVGSADAAGEGAVLLSSPVPLSRWKAVHVDDGDASHEVLRRAAGAHEVAMDDDHPDVEAAMTVLEEADEVDLLWHAVDEVPALLST